MEMQDNEFDKLFRSKLDNLEVEPSADVWKGITTELASGQRKRYLFALLSIAASVLILATAGILFIPHSVKINSPKTVQQVITKTKLPDANATKSRLNQASSTTTAKACMNDMSIASGRKIIQHPDKSPGSPDDKGLITNTAEFGKPVKTDNQAALAATPQKQPETVKPVLTDDNAELTAKQTIDEPTALINKPVLPAAQLAIVNKQDATPLKPKHKIHSLGDFLNVVVAAVDKRRDKIIEFSDTDDDESTITGINLGVVKLKK